MVSQPALVRTGSPEFQRVFAEVRKIVRSVFPNAKDSVEWGMPGGKVPSGIVPTPDQLKGTVDPRFIHIYLVGRKAGITLHLWNPMDYDWLSKRAPVLQKAGFKVMRGCLQFNRKADYPVAPVAAVEDLLRTIRRPRRR